MLCFSFYTIFVQKVEMLGGTYYIKPQFTYRKLLHVLLSPIVHICTYRPINSQLQLTFIFVFLYFHHCRVLLFKFSLKICIFTVVLKKKKL